MIARSRFWLLLLALIVAVAVAARAFRIFAEPLWLDEAYSAYAAAGGFRFLWTVVPAYETHPPFYYSLVRAWSLLGGDGLAPLRSLGLAAGLATLPVLALCANGLARSIGFAPRAPALAAAAVAAAAPMLVEMTREVRPYPVLTLVVATAILAILKLGEGAERGRLPRGWLAAYLATLALTLWLHNLGVLFAGSLAAGALIMMVGRGLPVRSLSAFLGGHVLVGLIWLPAILIAMDQAPTWVASTWLRFRWETLHLRLEMLYSAPGHLAALLLAGLVAAGFAALLRTDAGRRASVLLAAVALLPPLTAISISVMVAPIFLPRTLTPVMVPVALLAGLGATAWRGPRRWLAGSALLVLLALMLRKDWQERRGPPQQNWYGTLRWLDRRDGPGDLVLAYPNEGALPFNRAARDLNLPFRAVAIPAPVPAFGQGGWYPTGSRGVVSLGRPRLARIAALPRLQAAPTIWLLRLGPWTYDKGDVFLDELSRGREQAFHLRSGPIDLIGLSSPRAAPAAAAVAR